MEIAYTIIGGWTSAGKPTLPSMLPVFGDANGSVTADGTGAITQGGGEGVVLRGSGGGMGLGEAAGVEGVGGNGADGTLWAVLEGVVIAALVALSQPTVTRQTSPTTIVLVTALCLIQDLLREV